MSITLTTKWDRKFFDLAKYIAKWSKDPSTKVGAVVAKNPTDFWIGYNGFPPGIEDNTRLKDREEKYKRIIHAEINALLSAGRAADGATLYLYGMPGPPCSQCALKVIRAGIQRVVTRAGSVPERWREDFSLSTDLLAEAGIKIYRFTEQ